MHIVLCYPFLDLRFLIESVARPGWLEGRFKTVGSLGPVIESELSGDEAEIRADAALAFGKEREWRDARFGSTSSEPADGGKKRQLRQRKYSSVSLGDDLTVTNRRLLADSEGHVRLELVLRDDQPSSPETLPDRLERALTTKVYVVREESRPELISAGFNVARQYLKQSAKTAFPSEAVVTQLVREGAGSPFLVVVHDEACAGTPDGTRIDVEPAMFNAVTCQLLNIAGRTTGVWQIWGAGAPKRWMSPVRTLCRIICQLSELTLVARLKQEPQAYAPHQLDELRVGHFFRVRDGQLKRPKQGVWSVGAVIPLAAQHVRVAPDEALHSREGLTQYLRRDVAGAAAQTLTGIVETMGAIPLIPEEDRKRLTELLASKAAEEAGFLDRLVDQAELPESFKAEWANLAAPEQHAARLIGWALDKSTNPAAPTRSTLASLLLPELPRLALPEAALVVAFVSAYRLIHDSDEMSRLRIRYQTPVALPGGKAEPIGPDIDWRGPPDSIELQSWFAADPPDFISMSYLAKAMQHSASVCLVKVPINDETGTGVLIGERLVLTNYHVVVAVLAGGLDVGQASMIEVTFGKFDDGAATVSTTLDSVDPIPDWSPTDKLDYALLRLADTVSGAMTPRVATLSTTMPKVKTGLSILQHPKGGDMMLAPSNNAVAHIDPENGLIQYLTRTGRGSSGAPCFDDQWEVAAIHHAERSLTFGTIREGILISHIRERIKRHLN